MPDGFYQTPNINVPLNKRNRGELAEIALQQLALWDLIAEAWDIRYVVREDRECNICAMCAQNIYFTSDKTGNKYDYNEGELRALIVAHIRQRHPEAMEQWQPII